jgi:hypothetical protein
MAGFRVGVQGTLLGVLLVALTASSGAAVASAQAPATFGALEITSTDTPLTIFQTTEPLASSDTDSATDVYVRAGLTSGDTHLLSDRIQAGADAEVPVIFKALELTSTGEPLTVFETAEPLTSSDTDGADTDVYMRSGLTSGTTHLLSDRIQAGADGDQDAAFRALELTSTDNPLTIFQTAEPLTSSDGDPATDVYMRSGLTSGTTHLSSDRIQGGGGDANKHAFFRDLEITSEDTPLMIFETKEALLSSDADGGAQDVYMRSGFTSGGTHLLSDRIQAGADATTPARFSSPSGFDPGPDAFKITGADTPLAVFETSEPLTSSDTDDGNPDVYMHSGRTPGDTHLLSDRIQAGADDNTFANFKALDIAGTDTPLTVFETGEDLLSSDTDGAAATDVYMRSGRTSGDTHLLSDRIQPGVDDSEDARFRALELTGGGDPVTIFETTEAVTSSDTDSATDVYLRSGLTPGSTHLPSDRVQAGADAETPVTLKALELTGAGEPLTIFETTEPITSSDTDAATDVYMRSGLSSGATHLPSDRVKSGPDPNKNASFKELEITSADTPLTVVETVEALLKPDTDGGATDVYIRSGFTSGSTHLPSDRIQAGNDALTPAAFKALEITGADTPLTIVQTAEPLTSSDTDTATDVYMRSGLTSGDTHLVSTP